MDKNLLGRREPGQLPAFVVALARTHCMRETADVLSRRLELLSRPGPAISGNALDAIPTLPKHMRRAALSNLHVLCRLRRLTEPLLSTSQLADFLENR
eukprot:6183091-Pleurochrysis_carterae.AAC.1